ncbi:MAG TPA: hypothetical protein PLA46_07915, partial [Phycicoccus sp.]|nr:hypothetical protein [Phycicoccus sp.]
LTVGSGMSNLDEKRRKRIRYMPLLRLTDAAAPTFDRWAKRFNAWADDHNLPVHVSTLHLWYVMLKAGPCGRSFSWCGRFKKRVKDSYNPKRWGGHVLGLEIGRRG